MKLMPARLNKKRAYRERKENLAELSRNSGADGQYCCICPTWNKTSTTSLCSISSALQSYNLYSMNP
uniref:Uncharacterized protein n=1 Tax=Onchocerca volvulus TaxID=6282 RepID=A0A8R1TKF6_ONCVO